MVNIDSWGRLGARPHHVSTLYQRADIAAAVQGSVPALAYGMGRSYGDACLNPGGRLLYTGGLDRFISFDRRSGVLRCEAGVLLREIQQFSLPCGWMLAVSPGTELVTVGGAIANDVHGKNQHSQASFGNHVRQLRLIRSDGTIIDCGPLHNANWFAATVGGIGLTGIISEVELQLRRVAGPWLDCESLPYADLDEFFALADSSALTWEYTVAWIDCRSRQGRGIFLRGRHSQAQLPLPAARKAVAMPVVPPFSLINRVTLPWLNRGYYYLQRKRQRELSKPQHYQHFFYPLDHVLNWNRMYGPRGFYQYQCVLPSAPGPAAVAAMLAAIKRSGEGSFLAVLKTFGVRASLGMLSFPTAGVSLALDFPNRGASTTDLFEQLNAIVAQAGGRLYLAKDACMPRALFSAAYSRLNEFSTYRDPGLSSAMSRRLMGY